MNSILVLIKEPGKRPEFHTIPNDLHVLQLIVGGYIECVTVGAAHGKRLVVICDEEGRLKDKPICGYVDDIGFCGTIIIAGAEEDYFSSIPLMKYEAMQRFPELYRMHEEGR